MKRCFLSILVLCMAYLPVGAQNEINDYVSLNEQLQILGSRENESTDYKGSPYWEEEFIPGRIVEEGRRDMEAFFRYNVLQDQVEIKVKQNQEEIFVLPRSENLKFEVDGYTYQLKNYQTEDGDLLTGYLLNFFEGDDLIFVGKPTAKITAAQKPQTSYDRPKPATVRLRSHYYLGVGEKPLKEVELKEKDFRKILGDGKGMEKYFKDHKIRNTEDIVEMLRFYEENN